MRRLASPVVASAVRPLLAFWLCGCAEDCRLWHGSAWIDISVLRLRSRVDGRYIVIILRRVTKRKVNAK